MNNVHPTAPSARSMAMILFLGTGGLAMAPGGPEPADLFRQSALEQQALIWKEVEATAHDPLPEQDQAPANDYALLARSENLVKVFQYEGIIMPEGRRKATHQFGTVAKVEFEAKDAGLGYTGIFRSGAPGVLRLSLAKANPAAGGGIAYIPNLSFKVLRDASPDTNILAMHSIEGLGREPNFFAHSFSNFPGPGISLSLRVFSGWLESALGDFTQDRHQLRERARVMPLAESTLKEADGTVPAAPHGPYELIFMPNPKFYAHFQSVIAKVADLGAADRMKAVDFRRVLAEPVFDQGEVLFEVYARDKEAALALWEQHWGGYLTQFKAWWKGDGFCYGEDLAAAPAQSVPVGRIVLRSRFVASRFGDQLPFRHPTLHEPVPAAPSATEAKVSADPSGPE